MTMAFHPSALLSSQSGDTHPTGYEGAHRIRLADGLLFCETLTPCLDTPDRGGKMLLNASNSRRRRLWSACAAVIVAAVGLSGCEKCNLMGSNFADNSLAEQVRPYRKSDGDDGEKAGVSSKSQQIEADLGFK